MPLKHFDLVFRNGTIVDGTGNSRFGGDLGIRNGRLEAVGDVGAAQAASEFDLKGKIVSPGFIDVHTHDDQLLFVSPEMSPKVSQGVTTVLTGLCGISLAPLISNSVPPPLNLLDAGGAYRFGSFHEFMAALETHPSAVNVLPFVGHCTLRVATMDDVRRPARPDEIHRMQKMVGEAMAAGAGGVSTGLAYRPAANSTTDEVIEICRPMAGTGGVYLTHLRDEGGRILDSLDEAMRIGQAVGAKVVISHLKVIGTANHGRSAEILSWFDRSGKCHPMAYDCYPYHATSTILVADRATESSRVMITWSEPHPEFAGWDLSQAAEKLRLPVEAAVERLQPAGAVYFALAEEDVVNILRHEGGMIGSDGLPHDKAPHPRLWGTFPRVLGHYCREQKLFPLETAVRKMTGLAADCYRIKERGLLKPGFWADLVVFDEQTVADSATYDNPIQAARGIDLVVVNGEIVWRDGCPSGRRPGRLLRRSSFQPPVTGGCL
ncbi:MAG: D-aminoacylase [Verrucomicrobiae bacterium]|nr:D-aminoacylase [Verrucomicrobiae bacterium]